MKILFIDTVHPFLWKALTESGHECVEGHSLSRAEVLSTIGTMEGVVLRSRIVLDKELLDAAGRLKFIARAGAGMESIDVNYARQKGIACLNSPEGNRDAVGEHALGMLLSLFNNLCRANKDVREGKWQREENRGTELNGKTIALIGYGNTGSSFAKKLSGFGCKVLAYDKYKRGFSSAIVQEATMEQIFAEAEILSLHVPLSDETKYLFNSGYLEKFRADLYVVNTARGMCLKTEDLVKGLISGKVKGACLDVLEYEDFSFEKFAIRGAAFESSEIWQYLIHSDRVLLSPHIAGWTVESYEKLSRVLFEKIKALIEKQSSAD